MNSSIEQHLRELGVMPEKTREGAERPDSDIQLVHLAKDHFNDPRDTITGEVPY